MKVFSSLLLPSRLNLLRKVPLSFQPASQISFLKKGLEKMKAEEQQKAQANVDNQQGQKQQISKQDQSSLLSESSQASQGQQLNTSPFGKPSNTMEDIDIQRRDELAADQEEFENMSKQHRSLQAALTQQCDVPFKLYGMLKLPKTKAAYMPERVFAQHKIPKHLVIDHLKKIYFGTLHSIAAIDEEFLREYLEPGFAEKLIQQLIKYKNEGFKIEVYQDNTGIRGEPITQETYMGDMVMIRGLDVDRSKNLSQNDYHMWKDIDDMGLIVYTPNYLSDPLEFINPDKNKTIYDEYTKVIMRVMLYLKNPIRLRITKPDGTVLQVDELLHTWEHLALFETQMKVPPKFKSEYKLENYMEWLGKFNFGVWKLADLDNWNLGNPLIVKDSDREKFKDEIFKDTKYDPETHIDIKNV